MSIISDVFYLSGFCLLCFVMWRASHLLGPMFLIVTYVENVWSLSSCWVLLDVRLCNVIVLTVFMGVVGFLL